MPPDRTAEVQDILRRIGWGETIEQYETVRLRKDGSAGRSLAQHLSDQDAVGRRSSAPPRPPATSPKAGRTQHALRQQIEERRRIFETSQDLILVIDPKGSWFRSARAPRPSWDITPQEMIGRNASEFLHPDDLEISRKEMRAGAARTARADTDSRYIHKDGRVVTLSWMGTWSEPVRRYFFVGRDMTESRLAQETLRESEQLARGIIDTALDAFVQIDESGSILNWNSQAEKIFGWSREEVLGQELHRPDHSPRASATI